MNDFHNMFTDLLLDLHTEGHEVLVVAPAYDESVTGIQIEDSIQVLRVPTMQLFNVGKIQKGIANLLLPYQYRKALRKSGIDLNFDLVIMPTPPITLAHLANWFKKKYKSKVYLILRDIFPQNAVDLKMMNPAGIIFKFFRKKEIKMYNISDAIGCMSQGNIDYVLEHNPDQDSSKFHLLPNWGRLQNLLPELEIQKIRTTYDLQNKFVVIFGGNIGKPQKMENIVALAKACEDIPDIFFFIVGGGNEKDNLEKQIVSEQLNNIKIQGYLSREAYFNVLQTAHVGLISLSEDFTIPNYPSKALVYLNAKVPILASVDLNTDFGRHMEEIDAGLWAEAGKTQELKEKLLLLYNDSELRKRMGENGYNYMKSNLLTSMASKKLIEKISNS